VTDSYDDGVKDISVDESGSGTYISKVEIADSDSDRSVDIQAVQWVEMQNSSLTQHETCKQSL
jgi:hypothetical protein